MKYIILLILFATYVLKVSATHSVTTVIEKKWSHGAGNCETSREPDFDILKVDEDTFILRQSKCQTFEAPFIYLFFGEQVLFIQDTGAVEDAPLFETINTIITNRAEFKSGPLKILVSHSHGHSDHNAADKQFKDNSNVELIAPKEAAVDEFFGFNGSDDEFSRIDLGGRELTIFKIPGHDKQSIAVYDHMTKWLLTGDSFYPGRLYVRDWLQYRDSIDRLVRFTESHPVSALMGTHIEMSRTPSKDYPIGTIYQPNELPLPLSVDDLKELHRILLKHDKAEEINADKFIISPVGAFQKILGSIFGSILG